MRSAGGVDAWRERLQGEASPPSYEDIAVRVYELYMRKGLPVTPRGTGSPPSGN